jgi:hypothetical protein
MPRIIFDSFDLSNPSTKVVEEIIQRVKGYGLTIEAKKGEAVKNGEEILVFLKHFKIGDNHEPWIKGDAEVSVTFQFATHEITANKVLGTFKGVKKNSFLPVQDVLLMSRTTVQDHLTINIDAMELDQHEYSRISTLLGLINGIVQKIPIPNLGSVATIINELAGAIISLVSSLDEDDVIMRETRTCIVDKETYGDNFTDDKYLNTGLILFQEKLDEATRELLARISGKVPEKVEPTIVVLQVVKRPKNK